MPGGAFGSANGFYWDSAGHPFSFVTLGGGANEITEIDIS